MARIAISGASGLIGKTLRESLVSDGHRVQRLVRGGKKSDTEIPWDPANRVLERQSLSGIEAFIHLSGEPIAAGRFTASRKQAIVDSRVTSTRLVAETLARLEPKPAFLCASAIGYYGDRGSEWLEETSPAGRGFLSEACVQWERACDPAREAGARVVNLRFGIAFDGKSGPLAALATVHRLALGGRIGPGTQYLSWISTADIAAAVKHLLATPALVGPVNLVSPDPVTNADLSATLARVLSRPAFFHVPAAALRLVLGEAADETLLASQRVRPAKLVASGFRFKDSKLEPALKRMLW